MNYEQHEINLLKNQIEEIEKLKNVEVDRINALEERIQEHYNKIFSNDPIVKKAINDVENSNDYRNDDYGEISSYLQFDFSNYEECKDYLEEYFQEYHIYSDIKNDSIFMSQGESIVINHDDDIFDGHKVVVHSSEYENELERNELVEAYMEKTECFPGVFSQDYHCNISLVKTQNGKIGVKNLCDEYENYSFLTDTLLQNDNSLILDENLTPDERKNALIEIKDFSIKTDQYTIFIELLTGTHCTVKCKFKNQYIENGFIELRENLQEAIEFLQHYAD